ncbi:MAG: outer membrane protein assembly factor BamB [Sedimenticola sp.]|uniref:Outer membrane protein assembly factor BamB n=1 Tax=Sedimenticola thiotaurini TaxID=1543721 RepID=A0A558D8H4_9GAMM|nr:outer membrane protein assembly factor BamB [Sedimenticola sp.]MCW9021391.1 outer membrane protein assembly factor BamB [Sedimenticola sp.]TVT57334.1 MAG: outer membrane protein assembly factor BamB [Sedimenticola thiotaurini]
MIWLLQNKPEDHPMLRFLTVPLLALLLTGCGSMNPMDWFSSEDNSEPPAELTELVNSVATRVLWTASVGGGADEQRVKLVPYVSDGKVYAASRSGEVRALDASTGRAVWSVDTDLEISGGPGAGDGLVLIGTSNGEVVALDAAGGTEKWRARVSSEVLSVPRAARGVVVVHTIDGKLFGLDAATGTHKWIYDRSTPVLTLHGSSSPVIVGNRVICGFASGKLVMLNLSNGDLLWEISVTAPSGRSELERMVDIDGDPLVVGDVVFVTTYQGEMAAISIDTGVVLWRRKLSSYAGMGADFSQLYVSDDTDHVLAVDPGNGAALWKNQKLQYRKLTAPIELSGIIMVGDFEGYLHQLSREDGRLLGRLRIAKSAISTPPIVRDGVAYIYADGGELAAVTISDR